MPIVTPASAKRVYRPELLERPSMAKFVVLSLLMHIWAVALLGDESDGGSAGKGVKGGWVSSFTANINAASASKIAQAVAGTGEASSKTPTPSLTATPGPPTNLANNPTEANASPAPAPASAQVKEALDVAPIAVISVETTNPQSDFVIPSISIAPLASPQSTVAPNFAAILMPPLSTNTSVNSGRGDFATYVPPIGKADTETPIIAADTPLTIAPIVMPALVASTAPATKTFDTFKPASDVEPAQAPPILPIEKIALPTNAVREFAPSPAVNLQNQAPVMPVQAAALGAPYEATPTPTPAPTSRPTAMAAAPVAPSALPTTAASKPTAVGEVASVPNAANPTNAAEQNTNTDKGVSDSPRSTATSAAQANGAADTAGAGASASPNQSTLLPIIPTRPLLSTVTPSTALDLDKLRQRARDIESVDRGSRLLNPFPTIAKPADKRDIEKIFDKALKRPDCKDECANMGLAAVVPLVRDAIKGNGCRW